MNMVPGVTLQNLRVIMACLMLLLIVGMQTASAFLFPGLGVSLVANDSEYLNLTYVTLLSWLLYIFFTLFWSVNLLSLCSYGASDFKNKSNTGPWELLTPEIAAIVTQKMENGHMKWTLRFVSRSRHVARISFPLLEGTPMDSRDNLFQVNSNRCMHIENVAWHDINITQIDACI